jgi:excisionase family DNA binding protein
VWQPSRLIKTMPTRSHVRENASERAMDELLLTIKEVARRVRVTDRTVRNWIKNKRLRSKRIGGVVRIARSDLNRAMKPKI